jgi:hypothetical protein
VVDGEFYVGRLAAAVLALMLVALQDLVTQTL